MDDRASHCIRNNAEWCDGVCRSHGIPGVFVPEIWFQPKVGPPYYSNAITLSADGHEAQHTAIDRLHETLPDGFSVKDAFDRLDLSSRGFRTLFEAEWVWLDPPLSHRPSRDDSTWCRVHRPEKLLTWEAAWAANGSPTTTRVFLPTLLDDPDIAFFGATKRSDMVAGCIANRSSNGVVGFSNFFAPSAGRDGYRSSAVALVTAFAQNLPVVGYHRGDELSGLLELGFKRAGRLRVWISLLKQLLPAANLVNSQQLPPKVSPH